MRILVIGSAILDLIVRPTSAILGDSSNEAAITWRAGGAGRNIAESLARLGASVTFVTDAADDAPGRFLVESVTALGIEVRIARRARTGVYLALLDAHGGLDRGFCQTETEAMTAGDIDGVLPELDGFDGAVIDANLNAKAIDALADRCRRAGVPYALETVAHERSRRVAGALPGCAFIKPDRGEAAALTGLPCATADDAAACARALLARGAHRVVVSLGEEGLVFATPGDERRLAALPATVRDVTGAGDALFATVFVGLLRGLPAPRYLDAGLRAAALTCAWDGAVNPALGPHVFDA